MDDALFHQCRHANGVAAVIAEGQEGAAVRDETTVQGDAVHDGGHAEFAHAVVDVAATLALGCFHNRTMHVKAKAGCALGVGQVGAGQVG